jgi:hypothetical protein
MNERQKADKQYAIMIEGFFEVESLSLKPEKEIYIQEIMVNSEKECPKSVFSWSMHVLLEFSPINLEFSLILDYRMSS